MSIVKDGDVVAMVVFRLKINNRGNESKIVVSDNMVARTVGDKTFFVGSARVRQGALGSICNYTYGDYKCIVTHNDSKSIQSAIELAESEICKMLEAKTTKITMELAALQKAKDFKIPVEKKRWN